ncbi:mucin-2-like [Lingula anatina]|uniref:Mucin-2-like n=1 Tax=Lingula anatina TaxID=7574 RepID=A0A1S3I206_LINAN|nr:mucin-2-like [Lingula anatina]|eukprot:XP_013392300.1 mucin-2-like [Lingula anatina]
MRGNYMYMEASYKTKGDEARLLFPTFFGSRQVRCVSFFYSMYSAGSKDLMGELKLVAMDPNGNMERRLWSVEGGQGPGWKNATVKIPAGFSELAFIAVRGSSYLGDIAIDDVVLEEGECVETMTTVSFTMTTNSFTVKRLSVASTVNITTPDVPTTPDQALAGSTVLAVTQQPSEFVLNCTFEESSMCNFTYDRNRSGAEWIRHKDKTPSSKTGPAGDHTTGAGYYVYMEASRISADSEAWLLFPPLLETMHARCLRFYYHMYAAIGEPTAVGLLKVVVMNSSGSVTQTLWSMKNNQGPAWKNATVDIPVGDTSLAFVAKRAGTVFSDIAVDDVTIENGPCVEHLTSEAASTTESSSVVSTNATPTTTANKPPTTTSPSLTTTTTPTTTSTTSTTSPTTPTTATATPSTEITTPTTVKTTPTKITTTPSTTTSAPTTTVTTTSTTTRSTTTTTTPTAATTTTSMPITTTAKPTDITTTLITVTTKQTTRTTKPANTITTKTTAKTKPTAATITSTSMTTTPTTIKIKPTATASKPSTTTKTSPTVPNTPTTTKKAPITPTSTTTMSTTVTTTPTTETTTPITTTTTPTTVTTPPTTVTTTSTTTPTTVTTTPTTVTTTPTTKTTTPTTVETTTTAANTQTSTNVVLTVTNVGSTSTIPPSSVLTIYTAAITTPTTVMITPPAAVTTPKMSKTTADPKAGDREKQRKDSDDDNAGNMMPIIAGSAGGGVAVLLTILIIVILMRRRRQTPYTDINEAPSPRSSVYGTGVLEIENPTYDVAPFPQPDVVIHSHDVTDTQRYIQDTNGEAIPHTPTTEI